MISDFPFFFGQMPLEVEVRNFYAFAHIDGKGEKTVYRLTSAPTGSRWIPLLAQILSVAIANAAIKIAPNCAQYLRFQRQLPIDVCIDNIRVAGGRQAVTKVAQAYEYVCIG
jgi:hypothetical protein